MVSTLAAIDCTVCVFGLKAAHASTALSVDMIAVSAAACSSVNSDFTACMISHNDWLVSPPSDHQPPPAAHAELLLLTLPIVRAKRDPLSSLLISVVSLSITATKSCMPAMLLRNVRLIVLIPPKLKESSVQVYVLPATLV